MRNLEDDITFERVRHLPRRTRVCSVHRQLSWACHKEVQLYAKDAHVTTYGIQRSKTALQSRFKELQKIRKSLSVGKDKIISNVPRRASWPNNDQQTHQNKSSSRSDENDDVFFESTEVVAPKTTLTSSDGKQRSFRLPRSTSVFCETSKRNGAADKDSAAYLNDGTIPKNLMERRKTLPAI